MLERIDYIERDHQAVVYRCYGEGSVLELPEAIGELPVTELADHCFAVEPSFRYKDQEIKSAFCWQWEGGERREPEGLPALAGEAIRELRLPGSVTAIGDYAFYGCHSLSCLSLPGGLRRLGGGAFVACNHIRELHFILEGRTETGAGKRPEFEASSQTPSCMKEVIGELSYEVEVILEDEAGAALLRLTYPEYYEESIENTPARIIEIAFHGMGYKYRQCFRDRRLDFHQYDSHFPLATVQEFLPTLLKLAFNRLQTPAGLTEENRRMYLEWLQKEYPAAARKIFGEDRMDLLYLLGQNHYFTEGILERFLEEASRADRPEAVSYLMEYRRSRFAPAKKKKYQF